MKPTILEFNCETQEEVYREMTDAEYAQHLIDKQLIEEQMAEQAAEAAAIEAKKAAKTELLAALNLSQETIDLLNGIN